MVKDKVLSIINEVIHKNPKKLSHNLYILNADSFDLTDIVLRLENTFNISFTDEECFQIRYWSINKIIENIEKKIND